MTAVCAIPALLLGLWLLRAGIENAYVETIFAEMLPALLIGFTLFFMADCVNRRLGLLKIEPRTVSEAIHKESVLFKQVD